jgi:hypothetical protein
VVVLGLQSLLGCSAKAPPAKPAPKYPIETTGAWMGPCVVDEKAQSTSRATVTFVDDIEMLHTRTLSSGLNCQSGYMSIISRGNYALGGKLPDAADAYQLDVTLVKQAWILHTQAAADEFNKTARCGRKDWVIDREFDVTATLAQCNGDLHARMPPIYDIIRRVDGQIFLGSRTDKLNGSAFARRPTAIDAKNPYTKIM